MSQSLYDVMRAALADLATDYSIPPTDANYVTLGQGLQNYENQIRQLKLVIEQLEGQCASLHDACANYLNSKLEQNKQIQSLQTQLDASTEASGS